MIELTKDQQKAISLIEQFLDDDRADELLIEGSAGCGKTYLLDSTQDLVPEGSMIGTGPTHKSVDVLKTRLARTECSTIHSFLGLRPKMSKDKQMLVRKNNYDPSSFIDVRTVVLDESSMVDSTLHNFILKDIEDWGRKYIYAGDPYQLNPVGEIHPPLFATDYGKYRFELTQIVRQAADSPIIKAATAIRDAIKAGEAPPIVTGEFEGMGVYRMRKSAAMERLGSYVEKHDPDSFRMSAWRNETVREYNQLIRSLQGKDTSVPFSEGEFVVVNEAFTMDDTVIFNTGEEFTVKYMVPMGHNSYPELTGWKVILALDGVELPIPVDVLDYETCGEDYKKRVIRLADNARTSNDWRAYYRLKESFCDLRPLGALTTHKCLPLDANILTPSGVVKLQDLCPGVEEFVVSGKGAKRQVLNWVATGKKTVHEIKTKSGRTFRSSPEHRFLVNGEYKTADSIKAGQYLALWRSTDLPKRPEFDLDYYSYGYLVANGCYSYASNRVDVTLPEDSDVLQDITRFLGKYGAIVHVYQQKGNKAVTISAEHKQIRQELLGVGLERVTANGKKPCLFLTKNQKANFLQGLFDGDGSCGDKSANIRFVSVSERLVDEVMLLLQEFGIVGRKTLMNLYSAKHSQAYTLSVTGADALTFSYAIGFRVGYKQKRLEDGCRKIKGKSNVDFIPDSTGVKAILWQDIKASPVYGVRGTGGLFQGPDKVYKRFLVCKCLSYHQLESIVSHLKTKGVAISSEVSEVLHNRYFYDEVISSELTVDVVEMADIEVDVDHDFIYNGAIVHNCQGSTFDNMFVDFTDIYRNRILAEADRAFYVGLTRARHNVYILV